MSESSPNKSGVAPARPNNSARRLRRWIPYAGAMVLVGLITAGLWPQPVPVEVVAAQVGPLRATVNEEGKTRIKQRYLVSAPVTGQLRRPPFKAGAQVCREETIVAVIEPLSPVPLDARSRRMAEARRDAAAANLDRARAAHDYALSELKRLRNLREASIVALQELEAAEWRESAAAEEKAAAEGAVREAEAELAEVESGPTREDSMGQEPMVVKAPADGRVLRVYEESARAVTAGTPLLEIGDPTDLEVVIEVLSRDGAVIAPGTQVELEHWGGSRPLQAQVRLVEPAGFTKISALGVEEQRVHVIADLLTPVAERPGLGDDFRVEARIVVWEAERVLKVPSGALFRRGDQWSTFVVLENRARLRPVTVGRASGTEVQVLDGLQEGELLILYPGDRVRDGLRIKRIEI